MAINKIALCWCSTQVIHFSVNLYKGYNSTVETAKISKVNSSSVITRYIFDQ